MWAYLTKSTLKREFASTIMFWFLVMETIIIVRAPTWDQAYRAVSDCLPYVMAIATAAFGADFIAKQTNFGGPPTSDVAAPAAAQPAAGGTS